jgi:hypothetical protein
MNYLRTVVNTVSRQLKQYFSSSVRLSRKSQQPNTYFPPPRASSTAFHKVQLLVFFFFFFFHVGTSIKLLFRREEHPEWAREERERPPQTSDISSNVLGNQRKVLCLLKKSE